MSSDRAPRTLPLHVDVFFSDGRGPELRRIVWNNAGERIIGAEYVNPDWSAESDVRHVLFEAPQVVQITPEEVIGVSQLGDWYGVHRPAAIFDLGRTAWLESFSQTHLALCRHFQLLFYDQLLEVICEGVRCGQGTVPHHAAPRRRWEPR